MTEAIVYIMCSSVLSFIVKAGELHICEALWEGTIGDSEAGSYRRDCLLPWISKTQAYVNGSGYHNFCLFRRIEAGLWHH